MQVITPLEHNPNKQHHEYLTVQFSSIQFYLYSAYNNANCLKMLSKKNLKNSMASLRATVARKNCGSLRV